MDELKSFLCFLGCMLLLTFSLMGIVSIPVAVSNSVVCGNYGEMTQRKTEWRLFGGCFVEHEGIMIPRGEYQARAITNE